MRVSSTDFIQQYGQLSDTALAEPLTITSEGRDRWVLMSAKEYERIRRYVPQSRLIEELTQAELELISRAEVPPGYQHLDAILDD